MALQTFEHSHQEDLPPTWPAGLEPTLQKHLTPVGNSLGVLIAKPILELRNITRGTLLDRTTDGEALILRPIRQLKVREIVVEATSALTDAHAETLAKVAQ